tara:strand:+ start:1247 stop:1612 length:366 start_codon:yes stop_codon:yes gene_type:complete
MLVNIGYTVKFDDIPKVVRARIKDDVLREMGLLSAEIEGAGIMLEPGSDQNIFKSVQYIDTVRQGLALIDAKLQDCYSVLCGYQQELMKPAEQESINSNNSTTEGLISKIQQAADEINADG